MQVTLTELWIPILLGGLLAWVASGIIHMVIKYHNKDYRPLPNEDEVSDALRNGQLAKGMYTMPYCADMNEMGSDKMQSKFNNGPVAMIAVFDNGMPAMGKLLGQQIAFFIAGSCLVAYCTALTVDTGTSYMEVFRVVSAISFLAFGWANIPFSIWYGHPWSTTGRYLLDAIIYALVFAGTYAWLWPSAN